MSHWVKRKCSDCGVEFLAIKGKGGRLHCRVCWDRRFFQARPGLPVIVKSK